MSKFCGKCGGQLDEKTGLCPKCDTNKIAHNRVNKKTSNNNASVQSQKRNNSKPVKLTRKQKKAIKKANRTVGQKVRNVLIKILVVLLSILILVCGISTLLAYYGWIEIPVVSDLFGYTNNSNSTTDLEYDEEQYMVTSPDAEDYFEKNATINSKIKVDDSKNVMSEKETYNLLDSRGFVDYPITSEYFVDGIYNDAAEIENSSDDKHPSYQTYYITPNEEIWAIIIINGKIMASPISYNMQSNQGVPILISEAKTITSYDSSTNMFYETVPDTSSLNLKQVDKIDAKTLDKLTTEEIEKL